MGEDRLFNRGKLKELRQGLRNNATSAEVHLWCFLKGSQVEGVKFRRQTSIGPYVVDFYSFEHKLAIELDGDIHDLPHMIKRDAIRDRYIRSQGVRMIRFANEAVFENVDFVIARIKEELNKTTP